MDAVNNIRIYKEILDHSLSIALVTDCSRKYIYSNNTFKKLFGYTEEQLSSQPVMELLVAGNGYTFVEEMKAGTSGKSLASTGFLPIKAADGKVRDMYVQCTAIGDGKFYLWSGTDVSLVANTESELVASLREEHENVRELQVQKERLGFALDCALAVAWELDADLKHLEFSENFEIALGIVQADYDYDFMKFVEIHLNPYKEVVLQRILDYIHGKTDMFAVEITIRDSEQRLHWFMIRGKFIAADRKMMYGVSVDITEQKIIEQRLAELAYKDILTGLYRMEYLTDVLAGRIETKQLSHMGLMVMDIRHFRNINEAFGHKCGNDVLSHVAKRIEDIIRDRIIIRVGGDEYLVVFNNTTDEQEMVKAAETLLREFETPLDIEGKLYYINFKVGIAYSTQDNTDFATLFKDAEMALHHAKQDEINDVCVINDDIRRDIDNAVNMEYELRHAIARKEFYLNFQPVLSVNDYAIVGMEALIRWKHPERGMISPLDFIPLAEETGLIIQIGDFVLEEAMRNLQNWLKMNSEIYVAVNISTIQFMTHNFVERVKELMEKYQIPSRNLIFEVTESVFISEATHIVSILECLRGMGIRVSLDDFGTGYSSLSYLKKIPLDNLKIDRDFLNDVLEDPVSDAILRSIITLARNLKLTVTAEGVETKEQLSLLESYDCNSLQGFYFSKPVEAERMDEFILAGRI